MTQAVFEVLQQFCLYLKDEPGDWPTHKAMLNNSTLNYLFRTVVIQGDGPEAYIDEILSSLGMAQQRGRYINAPLTVYEFLVELQSYLQKAREDSPNNALITAREQKVTEFLNAIRLRNNILKKTIIGLVVFLLAVALPFQPFIFTNEISLIESLMAASVLFYSIKIIYTSGWAFYRIYYSMYDQKTHLTHWFLNNISRVLGTMLKLAVYAILIAAAVKTALITIIPALLIVASAIYVVNAAIKLAQVCWNSQKMNQLTDGVNLFEKQQILRQIYENVKQRNALLIELIATSLKLAVVVLGCLIPVGGIIAGIGFIVVYSLIFLAQYYACAWSKEKVDLYMEREFDKLEDGSQLVDSCINQEVLSEENTAHAEAEQLTSNALSSQSGMSGTSDSCDYPLNEGHASTKLSSPGRSGLFAEPGCTNEKPMSEEGTAANVSLSLSCASTT